jgi:hypothetical protein
MRDTSAEAERIVRDRMMKLSGSERFIMGAQMFEVARQMIIASLLAANNRKMDEVLGYT